MLKYLLVISFVFFYSWKSMGKDLKSTFVIILHLYILSLNILILWGFGAEGWAFPTVNTWYNGKLWRGKTNDKDEALGAEDERKICT